MKFEDVLPALREGKKVRRKIWEEGEFTSTDSKWLLNMDAIFEDDWEIPEPEPEPKWVILEKGMTIKEGDEFWNGLSHWWGCVTGVGQRYDGSGIFRRRIAK